MSWEKIKNDLTDEDDMVMDLELQSSGNIRVTSSDDDDRNLESVLEKCDMEWDDIMKRVLIVISDFRNNLTKRIEKKVKEVVREISSFLSRWDEIFVEVKLSALDKDDLEMMERSESTWKDKCFCFFKTDDRIEHLSLRAR